VLTRKLTTSADVVPPSSSPRSGVRGVIDSLVQGSLVELFAAYATNVAPTPRIAPQRVPTVPEISAATRFARVGFPGQTGRITLSLPSAVLEAMMTDGGSKLKYDWARELVSQLIGRIKNRLLPFSVRLEVGASSSIDSNALLQQLQLSSSTRVYAGRSRRGDILVTLDGLPDEAQLVYVGGLKVASEGDAILF
jgi:hypothetical protein